MLEQVDWEALHKLFQPRNRPAQKADRVIYNGEEMPRWLARDLMQERAAIYEFEAGLSREAAKRLANQGLRKLSVSGTRQHPVKSSSSKTVSTTP